MDHGVFGLSSVGWMSNVASVPGAIVYRLDDDWVDRFSYKYTTIQLFIFAIFVSIEQYVGNPISCWVPAHYIGAWEDYTNSYCWVHNTYYLPWVNEIPKNYFERDSREIVYYQWVPHILLFQAAMFFFPIVFWRSVNSKTGVDINTIVQMADDHELTDPADEEEKDKIMDINLKLMHRFLGYKKNKMRIRKTFRECTCGLKSILSRLCCCCCGKRFGNYLTVMYLTTKVLFLANVVLQFFMLNWFLGQNFIMYGIHVIGDSLAGIDWTDSRRFPKVSLCDVIVRRPGNIHRYTVQCALTGNLFYERIYLWLWFWFILVSVLTFLNLITWICRMLISRQRQVFVLNSLRYGQRINEEQVMVDEYGKWSREFVSEYLMADGVLVLRLLDTNSNKPMMSTLAASMWEKYVRLRQGAEDEKHDETAVLINNPV